MIATRLPQAHISRTLPTKDKKGRYLLPHACTSTLTQELSDPLLCARKETRAP